MQAFSLKSYLPAHSVMYNILRLDWCIFADAIRGAGAEAKSEEWDGLGKTAVTQSAERALRQSSMASAAFVSEWAQSVQRALRQRFLLRRLYKLRYSDAIRDDDDDAWLLLCSSQQFAPTSA